MTFERSIDLDGENTGTAKLTARQVLDIKRRLADGLDFYHDLAKDYGVSPHTIKNIKKGYTWAWLKSENSPPPHKRKRLNANQVSQIRQRIRSGEASSALSEEFKVSVQTIKCIKRGRTWAWLKE